MKVELKQAELKFQPIKIGITIESLEELKALRMRTVPSMKLRFLIKVLKLN